LCTKIPPTFETLTQEVAAIASVLAIAVQEDDQRARLSGVVARRYVEDVAGLLA
jgi:hypothetical protein